MIGKKATTTKGKTGTIVSVDGNTVAVNFENLPPVPNPGETEYFDISELEIEVSGDGSSDGSGDGSSDGSGDVSSDGSGDGSGE